MNIASFLVLVNPFDKNIQWLDLLRDPDHKIRLTPFNSSSDIDHLSLKMLSDLAKRCVPTFLKIKGMSAHTNVLHY